MALIFDWWVYDVTSVFAGLIGALYFYFSVKFMYWKKRGVPDLEATFLFGNLYETFTLSKSINEVYQDIYNRLKGHKYGGVFQLHRPTLVLRDPETIKCFLTKDFANFHDRGIYFDEENDPLSAHLFVMPGQRWRNLRAKLTPTFTSGKMKMMFQTIHDCGLQLKDCVKSEAMNGDTVEVKDLAARFSTDVIASCAFGFKCDSLKNPDDEFRVKGKEFMHPPVLVVIGFFLNIMVPNLGAFLKMGRFPKNVSDFFRNVVKQTVEYRESKSVTQNDFMQLLIQLKNKGYVDVDKDSVSSANDVHELNADSLKKLTLDQISAQAFVFFIAGFETSSTTVSFCLYEMALNPDIQTRLRQEMDEVLEKHGGQVTYDAIQEMEYLDRVVAETLRKYPPIGILNRECTVAYKLPDSEVILEPGTQVVVPVLGLHHDPQYYPEPERFDPERFTLKAKAARHHYAYLPFGEGPRICIGMRFGMLQTKIGLISLLSSYEVHVSEKTEIPLELDPKSFVLNPKGGVYLKIVNRTD